VQSVFVISRKTSPAIFDSQVLPLLRHKRALVYFYSNGNVECFDMKVDQSKIVSTLYLFRSVLYGKKYIFISREVIGFLLSCFFSLLGIRGWLKHDFRAIFSEELRFNDASWIKITTARLLEYWIWRMADDVRVCSNNMKLYFENISSFHRDCLVVPSFHNNVVDVVSTTPFKFSGPRFVYVGGMSSWQCIPEIIKFYDAVGVSGKSLTIITKDITRFNQFIFSIGYSGKINIISLDQNEVLNHLPNFDFGFIMRSNSVVNTTSSPLKFLEYASSGVVPIGTAYIGDFSNAFNGLMYTVDIDDIPNSAVEFSKKYNSCQLLDNLTRKNLVDISSTYSFSYHIDQLEKWCFCL